MEAERKHWVAAKSWRDGHSKGPVGGDEIVMVLNAELAGELRPNVPPPAEACSALLSLARRNSASSMAKL
jgi:hypothetical protein